MTAAGWKQYAGPKKGNEIKNNIKMKRSMIIKKVSVALAVAGVVAFNACSNESVLVDNVSTPKNTSKIEFGISLPENAVRSSIVKNFSAGAIMAVDGFQMIDGDVNRIFSNQSVTLGEDGQTWTYANTKYWSAGSTYDFYAMYPYDQTHTFNADSRLYTISEFVVEENTADQVDVMIAARKTGYPPHGTVDFVFGHLLSNVNFYFKSADSFSSAGFSSIDILSFQVSNLYKKGSYVQTGWSDANATVGSWNVDKNVVYSIPEVSGLTYSGTTVNLATDMLLMPQEISDDATVRIKYRLNYEDGSSTTFVKETMLASVVGVSQSDNTSSVIGSWYPKYRYNYTLIVDPTKSTLFNGSIGHDKDKPGADDKPVNVSIIQVPDTDGDGQDEYWVDEDNDGSKDYPLVWYDEDGDGVEHLYPDHDGDGIPDYLEDDDNDGTPNIDDPDNQDDYDSDGDGKPDTVWTDTDGDGNAETLIERDVPVTGPVDSSIPADPSDDDYPEEAFIDYDGAIDGYNNPTAWLIQVTEDTDGDGVDDTETWWVDTDGDGTGDIQILWKDVDGDGKLEGIADTDGDGVITDKDCLDGDGLDYNGDNNYYDVIMVDKDGDGVAETELERALTVNDPEIVSLDNSIKFSATVSDWAETYDANISEE